MRVISVRQEVNRPCRDDSQIQQFQRYDYNIAVSMQFEPALAGSCRELNRYTPPSSVLMQYLSLPEHLHST